jgi:hypothetical protein
VSHSVVLSCEAPDQCILEVHMVTGFLLSQNAVLSVVIGPYLNIASIPSTSYGQKSDLLIFLSKE